jgi:hypothetical protein
MRWYEKMSEGMRLMKEACADNENWDACWNCPFGFVCDKLGDAARAEILKGKKVIPTEYIPAHWREEEKT